VPCASLRFRSARWKEERRWRETQALKFRVSRYQTIRGASSSRKNDNKGTRCILVCDAAPATEWRRIARLGHPTLARRTPCLALIRHSRRSPNNTTASQSDLPKCKHKIVPRVSSSAQHSRFYTDRNRWYGG